MSTLIIQGRDQIDIVSEEDTDIARKIYLNGVHPPHLEPQTNGHSVGRWEGDVLVVHSIGYAGPGGADPGQHVVERISRSGDTLIERTAPYAHRCC